MSIGPMGGVPASAAGLPLSQSKVAGVERAHHDVAAQRTAYHARKADVAAGVGETDGEDHETAERDADGRLLWEPPAAAAADDHIPPKSQDPTGQSGNLLDLSG